jgi:Ca2+-binding EF-hand superfamily protein
MKSGTRTRLATAAILLTGAAGLAHFAQADDNRGGWQQAHAGYGERGDRWGGHHGKRWHGQRGKHKGKHHRHRRHGKRFERMLERFDTDKDGKLTQAEIDQAQSARLSKFDSDNNGVLSLNEFEQLWLESRRERMVRRFQRLDRDGDAGVTIEELSRRTSRLVERMDRNGDGEISREDRRGSKRHWRRGGDQQRAAEPAPEAPAGPAQE